MIDYKFEINHSFINMLLNTEITSAVFFIEHSFVLVLNINIDHEYLSNCWQHFVMNVGVSFWVSETSV